MEKGLIYLDTYVLQKDMRICIPKCVLENLKAEKGKTNFDFFLDQSGGNLVLKISGSGKEKED